MVATAARSWRRYAALTIIALMGGVMALVTAGWLTLLGWGLIKIGQWIFTLL